MSSNPVVRGSSKKQAQTKSGPTVGKKEERFDPVLFKAGVAGYLRSKGYTTDSQAQMEEWSNQAVEMWEIATTIQAENYANAVDALAAFKVWLDESGWTYQKPMTYHFVNLFVSVTMTTPAGTLTVGATVEPYIEDHAKVIRDVKEHLQAQIRSTFPTKSNGAKPAARQGDSEDEAPENETVHAEMLRVSRYNGKVVYHCMPEDGKWTQYGIPLYKDIAKENDIELPKEEGEYDVSWDIEYELKPDGRPRRVVAITEA